MANKVKPRDLTTFMQAIRNFISQRQLKNYLRFEDHYIPRTIPAAKLPPGVSHKIAANYYCSRDGRRESRPEEVVYIAGRKELESGEPKESQAAAEGETPAEPAPAPAPQPPKARRPGQVFLWDR